MPRFMEPIGGNILVKRDDAAKVSEGGIHLPDMSQKAPQEGTVIAVGGGKHADNGSLIPMTVQPGDKIVFTRYAPTEVEFDGKLYLLMGEEAILAIIRTQAAA